MPARAERKHIGAVTHLYHDVEEIRCLRNARCGDGPRCAGVWRAELAMREGIGQVVERPGIEVNDGEPFRCEHGEWQAISSADMVSILGKAAGVAKQYRSPVR